MNYAKIKYYDIANGPGVRVSLFVSGCKNKCKNCFQPETWDFNFGHRFNEKKQREILNFLKKEYIQGLTILGGEPFEIENQYSINEFLNKVKEEKIKKDIWMYTGYLFDVDLVKKGKRYTEVTDKILKKIDVLVDGKFIQQEYDISLKFRGSKNQRIIDVKKSLKLKKVSLINKYMNYE